MGSYYFGCLWVSIMGFFFVIVYFILYIFLEICLVHCTPQSRANIELSLQAYSVYSSKVGSIVIHHSIFFLIIWDCFLG